MQDEDDLRSTSNVEIVGEVDVYVAVRLNAGPQRRRQGQRQTAQIDAS
jgi:hypothetical protein